jgi:hypothetical protein
VQRPERGARHQLLLGLAGARAGIVEAEMDERVQARVAGLDPGDERVDHLDRRQIAPADAERQFGRRQARELVRERHRSLLVWIVQEGRSALVRRCPMETSETRFAEGSGQAQTVPAGSSPVARACQGPNSRHLAARVLND